MTIFWYRNSRPLSLPQSMLPALTAVASVIGTICLHLGMNLLDDWFDWKEGSAEARQKVANEGFRGLGELVIFLMFGPLLMTGVYYAITGMVDWKIAWLSIAVGLLVTNFIYPDGSRGLCVGHGTDKCEQCGFCMSGEMASVFAFKPDTIFAGLKLRA